MDAKYNALSEKVDARFNTLAARIEVLAERMDLNNRALNSKIESNQAMIMNALNIDKRLEAFGTCSERSKPRIHRGSLLTNAL